MTPSFWKGRRVFVTGHTGFKGSWICLWLTSLGAEVTGYALAPSAGHNLFEVARAGEGMRSFIGDIRDASALRLAMTEAAPEIVIHMAAQSLVRQSYAAPVETYSVNVVGTAQVMETVRQVGSVRAVVSVTTDKCYENREWEWAYRESDPLGGHDPYSSSKACAELVTASYRSAFLEGGAGSGPVAVATARAGNVIGGGDWAKDRLLPDVLAAFSGAEPVLVRHPDAIRPWQHVLEPVGGYMLLAERLAGESGTDFAKAWNFGPEEVDARPVRWIVERMCNRWGGSATWHQDDHRHPHEATQLRLDCSKARSRLGWVPRWNLETALDAVVDWHKRWLGGADMRAVSLGQIEAYSARLIP